MARRSPGRPEPDPILDKLDDLKRLAILQLLASGVQANQIAKALGVHKSVISRMVPAREITKLANKEVRRPS